MHDIHSLPCTFSEVISQLFISRLRVDGGREGGKGGSSKDTRPPLWTNRVRHSVNENYG